MGATGWRPSRQQLKVWFNRATAIAWVVFYPISVIMGWHTLVPLVWMASVYANVKSDWATAEAADNREIMAALEELRTGQRELEAKLDKLLLQAARAEQQGER